MPEELDLIGYAEQITRSAPPRETWIGDDCAVLAGDTTHDLLLCVDALVESIHFRSGWGLNNAGWKAVAINVSDIAAMGGVPSHILVSIAVPNGCDARLVLDGVAEACSAFGCDLVGGDTTASPGPLMISVTASGHVPSGEAVLRRGAHAGDLLFVTRPLGAAASALKQSDDDAVPADALVRPHPELAAGPAARRGGATAMIDISDGFALDLHRLLVASELGADVSEIPIATGATIDDAIAGGEDYALLIAASNRERLADAFGAAGLDPPVEVGRCVTDTGSVTLSGVPLARRGYIHRWD